MNTLLEARIASFAKWRSEMVSGIEFYKSWLDLNGIADIQQSLRIYDLVESLKHDRITLAFIAEFSRGKTELINAMLFGQFKRRILPSDVGRTTMCPTELMHDPNDEPYIRLLPIETRRRAETIASLKRKPVEWIKIRIDPTSETELVEALKALVQTKTVTKNEALALGLYDHAADEATTVLLDDPDRIEIPAWRHALVNYPHPLLANGLVVLDTPGLNALGSEPELTMSMIPAAHAVLFLLAMDAGVTRSDLDIWRKHVQPRVPRRLAVLNKADLLWDDFKSDEEIAESMRVQVETTARALELPASSVLAVSAKKALVARIRGDAALLARSGIEALESMLADEVVPAKQEIMRAAIEREIGTMIETSRQSIVTQFNALRAEHKSLKELAGKNHNVAAAMLARLEGDRANYLDSVARYRAAFDEIDQRGRALLESLSEDALETLMNKDRKYIENAWSTAGLMKNMQGLFAHFAVQSDRILKFSREILGLVQFAYLDFQDTAGFEALTPPLLNLEKHSLAIHHLRQTTIEYCHHPKQILTEKHFLVPNFYASLVAEARQVFQTTRTDTESWLRAALNPLEAAIKAHEVQLDKRVENLRKLQENLHSVGSRSKQLERELLALKGQHDVLVSIRKNISAVAPAAEAPASQAVSPANEARMSDTARAA
ncbi:MAG: hypothetical protein GEV05_11520 [Betaproteobacteria bacterium]|nr:hypothetical protein [Betaproteobacteria bacterium]